MRKIKKIKAHTVQMYRTCARSQTSVLPKCYFYTGDHIASLKSQDVKQVQNTCNG